MKGIGDGSGRRTVAWLALFATIAFAIRVGLFYHAVFAHEYVTFVETDAWYHMRLVDATVRHFPSRIWFDPFLVYPGGEPVNAGPFFDWVIAGAALIVGLGAPSPRVVDVVGAYTPAVMGALTVVPVYVLGRELFSRRAALWAAFIVGVLPGQILLRSALGYTDHHCAETLLSTTALMWLALALDPARPRPRRLRLSAAAGVSFGCYLLTWGGGSLFVLVVVVSAAASLIVQRLGVETADSLPDILAPAFIVAAVMIAPWAATRPYFGYDLAALAGGLGGLIVLRAWGAATSSQRHGTLVYLAGLVACVAMGLAVVWIARDGWSGLANEIKRIAPWRPAGYVREAMPLLKSPSGHPIPLWKEFASCVILALMGAVWYMWRPGAITSARGLLLLVWTGVMLAATFGQVRFAYYLGVNAALLAGFACDELLARADRFSPGRLLRGSAVAAVILVVAVPAGAGIRGQWGAGLNFTDDWYDALQWLQSNSPEPFETGEAYYQPALVAQAGIAPHAYGVLAWWDYGYWIMRVARRVPNTNPKQTQVKSVATSLLAETPDEAASALAPLGTRYVIVDAMLQASVMERGTEHDGFFSGMTPWAGRKSTDYCQKYELPESGTASTSTAQLYCFPKYYQTLAVRLYAFGGRAVTPTAITAIRWIDQDRGGRRVKQLEGQRTFGDRTEAERFIASHPAEHWRIASADPLISCVPLEAFTDFRQVFRSIGRQQTSSGDFGPSAVQIYEYRRAVAR